jgi:hypothetical protein
MVLNSLNIELQLALIVYKIPLWSFLVYLADLAATSLLA